MSTWCSGEGIEECPNPTPHDGATYSASPGRCKYTLRDEGVQCSPDGLSIPREVRRMFGRILWPAVGIAFVAE